MKKFIVVFMFLFFVSPVFAALSDENSIQSHIDSVGVKLLNKNKIQKRIVFTYDEKTKKNSLTYSCQKG